MSFLANSLAYDFEQITNPSVSTALTTLKITPADARNPNGKGRCQSILISASGADGVRFRYDGGDPTTTSGHFLGATTPALRIEGVRNVERFRVIAAGAAGSLSVTFERT